MLTVYKYYTILNNTKPSQNARQNNNAKKTKYIIACLALIPCFVCFPTKYKAIQNLLRGLKKVEWTQK